MEVIPVPSMISEAVALSLAMSFDSAASESTVGGVVTVAKSGEGAASALLPWAAVKASALAMAWVVAVVEAGAISTPVAVSSLALTPVEPVLTVTSLQNKWGLEAAMVGMAVSLAFTATPLLLRAVGEVLASSSPVVGIIIGGACGWLLICPFRAADALVSAMMEFDLCLARRVTGMVDSEYLGCNTAIFLVK